MGVNGMEYNMSQDKIEFEYIPLSELKRYPRNPKDHDLGAISGAIDSEVGFASPIIIDTTTGYIGAGHGRLDALSDLYRANPNKPPKRIIRDPKTGEWLVPCNKVAFEDEIQLLQFIIMDNKIGELGGWDDPLLADALTTLAGAGDGILETTGFDGDDLDELLKALEPPMPLPDTEPQIDKAKELQSQWQTERGQVWLVGGVHRVMCGDSTNADDVARLMDGKRADLLVTDPPYGVDYDPQWRRIVNDLSGANTTGSKIANDDNLVWMDSLTKYTDYWDVGYIWCSSLYVPHLCFSLEGLGYSIRNHIIWAKDLAPLSRGDYHWRHEPCLYVVKDGCTSNWQGARDQNTVWDIPVIHSFANGHNADEWGLKGHGNQKPIECMKRPILNNSADGQIILDLFLGSGTTLIVCAQTGRVCYGMEISPEYVAVILQRATDSGLECELLP